jgi:hypothetical protein
MQPLEVKSYFCRVNTARYSPEKAELKEYEMFESPRVERKVRANSKVSITRFEATAKALTNVFI